MHRNAPLTPEGRHRLCQRIEAGWPVAHAAESMHISRDRAYVWWRRYQSEGVAGLQDRSSRPHRSPARTKVTKERRIVGLRTKRGLGPARIATAPSWPSGLTRARGPQRADESVPLCAGCTSTTITDTTPRSVARPCTASAT